MPQYSKAKLSPRGQSLASLLRISLEKESLVLSPAASEAPYTSQMVLHEQPALLAC